jgi:acyl-CoA thioester hydrolase/1,4-dihydroxy-2-naphthoyl-CoA hydrolase
MFKTNLRVNFYDCDPAGILFFANLFKFAHTGYEQMMESFNLEIDFFDDENYVLPIITSAAKFIKPIKSGDRLELTITVSNLKDSSFELSYTFLHNNFVLAEVKTVHVCVDKNVFKKVELPGSFKDSLKANLI